jgi:hypothetical protein
VADRRRSSTQGEQDETAKAPSPQPEPAQSAAPDPGQSDEPSQEEQADSRTAARVQLDALDEDPEGDPRPALEQQASEQEEQQQKQLASKLPGSDRTSMTIAEQRNGQRGETPFLGRVDNMTVRSDEDPLEGHFVYIDFNGEGGEEAKQAVSAAGVAAEPGLGSADYGIYLQPGSIGEDGYPETAVVQLRDEHAAVLTVPYSALKRAPQGGRR